jgi:glycosyltransferase involved in cell wall biosynthesis
MRIGLVTGEYPPRQGGVGDFTRELGATLAGLGHEAHVITREETSLGAEDTNPESQDPNFRVHRAVRGWSWAALWGVRALARRLGLEVLNVQYQAAAYDLGAPIHFLPRLAGVPVVVTFHDLRIPYLFPKAGGLRRRAVLALARSASAAIVTNAEDEESLRRAGGVRRLAQIPIGSNIAPTLPKGYDRTAWRARLGFAPGDWLLGYFGFLSASKGGETLVRALARLAEAGCPARLLLIGGPAGASDPTNLGYGGGVDTLTASLGVRERVQRTGFVHAAEVPAHLAACDVLVLPYADGASFRRGSLMAALAHGCAIVSTTPAVPQAGLQDGENIRLAPPGDAEACASAVQELMADPTLRERLGRGARALAAEFDWKRIAERTAALLSEVA